MAWKYSQSTGKLVNPSGSLVGTGYSGHGEGLNNPAMQNVADVGPIPQGRWTIGTFFDDPGGKGPLVAHLTPWSVTKTFGRSGFMVHGDNEAMNHTASEGCVVLAKINREQILACDDRLLTVTE
jgi:hypothetical protein